MKRISTVISLGFLVLISTHARGASEHKHKKHHKAHSHGAHQHGHGNVMIVVEDGKVGLELSIPSESIYGFEHQAKSATDKAVVEKSNQQLNDKLAQYFLIPSEFGCVWSAPSVKVVAEEPNSSHSDVVVKSEARCSKKLDGAKMRISLGEGFKRIEKLKVMVVTNQNQKSSDLLKGVGEVVLP